MKGLRILSLMVLGLSLSSILGCESTKEGAVSYKTTEVQEIEIPVRGDTYEDGILEDRMFNHAWAGIKFDIPDGYVVDAEYIGALKVENNNNPLEYVVIYIETLGNKLEDKDVEEHMQHTYATSGVAEEISEIIPATLQGIDYKYMLKKTKLSTGETQHTSVYFRTQGYHIIRIELGWQKDDTYNTLMKGFEV